MKNLYKSESLPQIRNLHKKFTQLSSVNQEAGGRNEVNDEGKKETYGDNGPWVSKRHGRRRKRGFWSSFIF